MRLCKNDAKYQIALHCNGKEKPDKKTKPQNKFSRRFLPFFPLEGKQCQVESSDSFKDNLKIKFVKQRMQQAAPPSCEVTSWKRAWKKTSPHPLLETIQENCSDV